MPYPHLSSTHHVPLSNSSFFGGAISHFQTQITMTKLQAIPRSSKTIQTRTWPAHHYKALLCRVFEHWDAPGSSWRGLNGSGYTKHIENNHEQPNNNPKFPSHVWDILEPGLLPPNQGARYHLIAGLNQARWWNRWCCCPMITPPLSSTWSPQLYGVQTQVYLCLSINLSIHPSIYPPITIYIYMYIYICVI